MSSSSSAPRLGPDEGTEPPARPERASRIHGFPDTATATPVATGVTVHVRDLIPAEGFAALVFFSDPLHNTRALSANQVDARLVEFRRRFPVPVPVFGFGHAGSIGTENARAYLNTLASKAMRFSLLDDKSDLARLLKADGRDAVCLVRDGLIVWELISPTKTPSHDLDGLLAEVVRLTKADAPDAK